MRYCESEKQRLGGTRDTIRDMKDAAPRAFLMICPFCYHPRADTWKKIPGDTMLFWIIAIAVTLVCGAILGRAILRGHADATPPAACDLQVYRDQLSEIERDRARGLIAPAEAERLHAEVSRRILAADARLRAAEAEHEQPRRTSRAAAALVLVILLGGSAALYARLGAPGAPDLPLQARLATSETNRANRLTQEAAMARFAAPAPRPEASGKFLALMEKLRKTVKERPDDLRGLGLLARNEAALGNLKAAYQAQARIIKLKGPDASAEDHVVLADLMISAAGGYVSKEAEAAIRAALERDPQNPWARYLLGHYLIQIDRPDMAFRTWKALLEESPPKAPWVGPIRKRIEEVAWRAGVRYQLPRIATGPGPSESDIKAAGQMSTGDRTAMIRSMVARLASRLDEEGGSAAEWARLINAYGVLGDSAKAQEAWESAKQAFAGQDAPLATLRAAAQQAGIVQ